MTRTERLQAKGAKRDGAKLSGNQKVSCPHCGTQMKKKKLERHIRVIHSDEPVLA